MSNFQSHKQIVLDFYTDLDRATDEQITEVIKRYTTEDYFWRGMHPFYEQRGAEAVARVFLATPSPIIHCVAKKTRYFYGW